MEVNQINERLVRFVHAILKLTSIANCTYLGTLGASSIQERLIFKSSYDSKNTVLRNVTFFYFPCIHHFKEDFEISLNHNTC